MILSSVKVIFSVCLLAKGRIKGMCEYFEKTEQIVEFNMAVNEIFKAVKIVCCSVNHIFYRTGQRLSPIRPFITSFLATLYWNDSSRWLMSN